MQRMCISSEYDCKYKYRGKQAINATLLPGNLGPRMSSASPPESGEKSEQTEQTEQRVPAGEPRASVELTAIFTKLGALLE